MSKKIVVETCTLKFKTPPNDGAISILPPPVSLVSLKDKCEGNKIYKMISFTVTGATNGTIVNATGAGVINGNSEKVKADNQAVVLEDAESADVTFTGFIGTTPGQTFVDRIVIKTVGQSKVKGL